MLEIELPDNNENWVVSPCWDDNEEDFDDMDDEFCSDSYDEFQSIEDKSLLDSEDDDLEYEEIEF